MVYGYLYARNVFVVLLHYIMDVLRIEIIKPNNMLISHTDLFVLLEINMDDVVKSEALTMPDLTKYIMTKYKDQPLQYFNETGRLKVIHLKSGMMKNATFTLDF